jgi:hypothetical protein
MEISTENHLDFAARVRRIEDMRASARQILFVGADEVYSVPRRDKTTNTAPRRAALGLITYPFSVLLAVGLGLGAHGMGQIARFHVVGLPDPTWSAEAEMLSQVVVGMVVAMVLGWVLHLTSHVHVTLKALGVVLGVLFFHNAVHLWPEAFAAATSEVWLQDVLAHSTPQSLAWRGVTYPL